MLRKASIALAIFAVLGVAVAAPADAKQTNKGARVNRAAHVNRGPHINRGAHINRGPQVNRSAHANRRYVVGRTYNGNIWYGHRRHFWHGTWYDYGVGSCWINVDGDWFWNVVACPP
jgi:hypothetical protein